VLQGADMSFLHTLYRAYIRERNWRRRQKQRTLYTYRPNPDERCSLKFWRDQWKQ
jgi:hypothetical protein